MSVSGVITREAVSAFQTMRSGGLALPQSFSGFSTPRNTYMISPQPVIPSRSSVLEFSLPSEKAIHAAHLVGICGSGMKALAEMLSGLGCRVSGSDLQTNGPMIELLRSRGLRIDSGHHSNSLPDDVDVLIYSSAVGPQNPERQMAARMNIPQCSYSQMLGHLMQSRVGVSIAGTHGKSTTTAMTASILERAGLSPSAVIGAELCDRHSNGWAGDGELFVVESCEYQRNFLDCSPRFGAILGIEPDHFDCFHDFAEAEAAFTDYAAQVSDEGMLVVRGDCSSAVKAAQSAGAKVATFSCQQSVEADWWASDLRPSEHGTRFRIFHQGQYFTEILLRQPGEHNVLNALAAVALSHYAGASVSSIRECLCEFGGIRRRFEEVGSWRGVTLIDDFAHHPTAIRETLKTARMRFPNRRLWVAFQPHQISRTEVLLEEFSESFLDADRVIIVPIYAAREAGGATETTVSEKLADKISLHHPQVQFDCSLDRLITTLEDETRPGDVFITMGAGDIDQVTNEFTRRLQRNYATE